MRVPGDMIVENNERGEKWIALLSPPQNPLDAEDIIRYAIEQGAVVPVPGGGNDVILRFAYLATAEGGHTLASRYSPQAVHEFVNFVLQSAT